MQSTPSVPDSSVSSTIIRTGSDGRLRFTPDQRQALLDAYDSSGMSAMAFARGQGVHYSTFIAWLRKVPVGTSGTFADIPAFLTAIRAAASPDTEPAGGLFMLADPAATPVIPSASPANTCVRLSVCG